MYTPKVGVGQVLLLFFISLLMRWFTSWVWGNSRTPSSSSSHLISSVRFKESWLRCMCCSVVHGASLSITHDIRIESSKRQMWVPSRLHDSHLSLWVSVFPCVTPVCNHLSFLAASSADFRPNTRYRNN